MKEKKRNLLKEELRKQYIPIAMFYLKMRDRNQETSKAKYHLFEYLIQMHIEFEGKEYHHSISDITRDTGFSDKTVKDELKYFKGLGLIDREVKIVSSKSKFKKGFIQLDHTKIFQLLPLMYDVESDRYEDIKKFYSLLCKMTEDLIDKQEKEQQQQQNTSTLPFNSDEPDYPEWMDHEDERFQVGSKQVEELEEINLEQIVVNRNFSKYEQDDLPF